LGRSPCRLTADRLSPCLARTARRHMSRSTPSLHVRRPNAYSSAASVCHAVRTCMHRDCGRTNLCCSVTSFERRSPQLSPGALDPATDGRFKTSRGTGVHNMHPCAGCDPSGSGLCVKDQRRG
jgi:hypothetical protein